MGEQGRMNQHYLSIEQIDQVLKMAEQNLPKGSHLVTKDKAKFFTFEVTLEAVSETEFKIYVHVPQYNLADGQFKAFSLSSLPFELADKTFGRIQPEKTILIHNSDENLFVEMTKNEFKADCNLIFGHYICPTIHEFDRISEDSCLMSLKQADHPHVLKKCNPSTLPKKELLVELEPNTYRVFYPKESKAIKICSGKKTQPPLYHNEDIKIEEGCKLITATKQINAKKALVKVTDENTAKFKFRSQEYQSFSPQPTYGDQLEALEDLTKNQMEKIKTGHSDLYYIVLGISIFLLVLLAIFIGCKSYMHCKKAKHNPSPNAPSAPIPDEYSTGNPKLFPVY